ncbi:uncharacterized protein LOC124326518 isoform X1 [Daphnia pulicaria]|uniref:uncharacterized protein LOC124326518 isoform X1 n=1 Tax=Daphnia pulicaria TaxID=35523 RepID=UPI001EE9FE98|nr:uncharacterized protein LOC124326518 isoform X1 [Daphnia pulicaria]
MARDQSPVPVLITPQTSLESQVSSSSCNQGNSSSQTVKSPWSRLRQRVHEVTGRSRNTKNHSSKYGSLLKLADEERRIIHGARRSNSQIRLNPTSDDGVNALWHIIHLLEERVEVLENTLEVSREHIAKTEEKCDNLQKQVEKIVEQQILEKKLLNPPLDAETLPDGVKAEMSRCFEQIRNKEYRLNRVEAATLDRTSVVASRNRRKCAGCGKGTF